MKKVTLGGDMRLIGVAILNATGPESFTAMLGAVEGLVTRREVVRLYVNMDLPVGDGGHHMSNVLAAMKERGLEVGDMSLLLKELKAADAETARRVVTAFKERVQVTAAYGNYMPSDITHVLEAVGDALTDSQIRELREMRMFDETSYGPMAGRQYAMRMLSDGFITERNVQVLRTDLEQVEATGAVLRLDDYIRVIDQEAFVARFTRYPHLKEDDTNHIVLATRRIIADIIRSASSNPDYLYALRCHMRAPDMPFYRTSAAILIAWGIRDHRITPLFLTKLRSAVQRMQLSEHVPELTRMRTEVLAM